MLGKHSEPRRDQMSHICDISPLRVKDGCQFVIYDDDDKETK